MRLRPVSLVLQHSLLALGAATGIAGAQIPPTSLPKGTTATIVTRPTLVDPVHVTSVSGFRDDELTWVAFGPGTTGVQGVRVRENYDKPCALEISGKSLEQGSRDEGDEELNICTDGFQFPQGALSFLNGLSTSDKAVVFDGNPRHYLRGIAVCTNNNNNHRLKGIRIYPASVGTDATVNALGSYEEFRQTNCSQWHTAVYCPSGQVASGLAVHHSDEEITGIALRCRRVVASM